MEEREGASEARDERMAYEPPQVLEDLPLEAYSLACDKATLVCDLLGMIVT